MAAIMKGRYTTALVFGVMDVLALMIVFNVIAIFRGVTAWDEPLYLQLILPSGFLVITMYVIEGYGAHTDFLSLDYASVHILATVVASFATLLATFVFFPAGFSLNQSRSVIVLGYAILVPLTLGYRRSWYLRAGQQRRQRTVIFVGDAASCTDFRAEFAMMGSQQSLICCHPGERDDAAYPSIIPFTEALEWIRAGTIEPEAIVLREASPQLTGTVSNALVNLFFTGVPIYTLEFFHESYWRKIPRYRLNQIWLFQAGFQITREPVFEHLKRLTDVLLAGIGLVLFAPFLVVGAIAILLDGGGPILFAQTRVGRNREPFRMFKLRTMRAEISGDVYTRAGDTRITRVGRFLRVSRLDEVPQLWNVLRGEMSLIGPRAEWDRLVERYEKEIPCYHFRHLVKPGITGWAQVNYPYGASMDDTMRKLEYDLYYIRHFSFRLDATIVLKTIHIMLFGKGR
jgi:exopolysaccharide biosynthesis polyprenyl glycosylphosphotransferase